MTTPMITNGDDWSAEDRLGITPDLLSLSDEACDCAAREDGGEGHDPECAFYAAVEAAYGPDHPLVRANRPRP